MKLTKSLIVNSQILQQPPYNWHLYIVQTRHGHWYTGITTHVNKRLTAHQSGLGAKNLKGKGPLKLIYQQWAGDRSAASKLEIQLKKLTKQQKKLFVNANGIY
ncbi:MAG: GIY-YIG nuclease family protein [Pseudoalteromonas sp.]